MNGANKATADCKAVPGRRFNTVLHSGKVTR
jgi:hypothetical protein